MSSYLLRDQRQHAPHRRVEVADVGLGRHLGGRRPGRTRIAERGRVQVRGPGLHHQAEREPLAGHQRRGLVDQRANRRDAAGADDLGAGDQRAEPVGDVDQLLSRHAREQVLVAAGEPDDLVREHRADDQRDVVLDDGAVDADLDAVLQHAAGELRDPLGADPPDAHERVRVPPFVIAHGHAGIVLGEPAARVAQVPGQRRLAPSRRGCRARRAR